MKCLPCLMAAALVWTPADTGWEIGSELGILHEWAQMTTGNYVHGFDEEVLGGHPQRRSINAYFGAWMLAHPLISFALPAPYRRFWQVGTIGFEIVVSRRNAQLGCRVHF